MVTEKKQTCTCVQACTHVHTYTQSVGINLARWADDVYSENWNSEESCAKPGFKELWLIDNEAKNTLLSLGMNK